MTIAKESGQLILSVVLEAHAVSVDGVRFDELAGRTHRARWPDEESAATPARPRLAHASAPVILVDVEVRRYALEHSVTALARKLAVPVVTTFMGRGLLQDASDVLIGTYLGAAGDPTITRLVEDGDALFFVADKPEAAAKFAGQARTKVGQEMGLIAEDAFEFCWIVDYTMFEYDETAKKIDFSHNPFSMPQGGLEALETQDPLTIKAWQYDIVCNGIELCSGAIRNHKPDIMYKAFGIAGYSREEVEQRFGGMLNAFKYGAPPHGGAAPGVDHIVMLLADEPNIREVITFPMNQQAVDLMMDAPT